MRNTDLVLDLDSYELTDLCFVQESNCSYSQLAGGSDKVLQRVVTEPVKNQCVDVLILYQRLDNPSQPLQPAMLYS